MVCEYIFGGNLGIQRAAMRMRHITICGLPDSTIFATFPHERNLKRNVT